MKFKKAKIAFNGDKKLAKKTIMLNKILKKLIKV